MVKRIIWYGMGIVGLALLAVWFVWDMATATPPPGGSAFVQATPTPFGPKQLTLYVGLALLGIWIIALIITAIVRIRKEGMDLNEGGKSLPE